MTIPPLIEWNGQASALNKFIEEAFAIFYDDFIKSQPRFKGCRVRCYEKPHIDGKEGGFWHYVTSDDLRKKTQEDRVVDINRCARIRWPRFIIENVESGRFSIDHWTKTKTTPRGPQQRHLLWFQEEYLVVLEEKNKNGHLSFFYLVTAYMTDKEHTKSKLRKERDSQETAEAVPP